jgi:hypothetical protein
MLFVIAVLLVILILDRQPVKEAYAQKAAGDILVVETADTSAKGSFFLVDTNKQILCFYSYEGNTRGIRLMAARKYDMDIQIPTEVMKTQVGYSRDDIENSLKKVIR